MNTKLISLESQLKALAAAVDEAFKQEQRLYRRDGKPVFSEEEMASRKAAIIAAVERQYNTVLEAIGEAETEADKLEALANGYDPVDRLTYSQQQEAATRAMFVKEDFDSRPFGQLLDKIKTVLFYDSTPVNIYLYARYARAKLEAVEKQTEQEFRAGRELNQFSDGPERAQEVQHKRAFTELLVQLEDRARGPIAAQNAAYAKELKARLIPAQIEAKKLLRTATGEQQESDRQSRNVTRSLF